MAKLSIRSKSRLDTCHNDIKIIINNAIKVIDFSVLEGIRSDELQLEYFETGRSQLDGINNRSTHQPINGVSHGIDLMPYAKGENAFSGKLQDTMRFYYLAGVIKTIAYELYQMEIIDHLIIWGGDWDNDDLFNDQNFNDLPHFELYKP